MTSVEHTCAVRMEEVTKTFGSVTANDRVTLEIRKGEILSLLGENGSGKTTLMNMLAGIYYPDSGRIFVNGKEATIASPKDAFAHGIGMIHQHFKLVNVLSAAENVVLGLEGGVFLDIREVSRRIREIAERYGFTVDPAKKVYDMSVSEKQTLEIVKLLYRGADILILDEPTAVLTPQETEKLFDVLRVMKKDGKAIVIITHKLHEVMEIADRVAVLRKGEFVGETAIGETDAAAMTNMMVGRQISLNIERSEPRDPKPRLTITGLTVVDGEGVTKLDHVSFTAMGGEILGVAGVAGSGQKELLEAVAGLCPIKAGKILYTPEGKKPSDLVGKTPMQIKEAGVAMAFVPEDRLGMGLVGGMGMVGNMMLRSWREGNGVFVRHKNPNALAEKVLDELEVVTPDLNYPVRRLSGGNVQKVLVGREIATAPSVLMSAYAVRGLDINTSYTIYNLMNQQKEKGVAVIFVGEDLDVLLELCDRILVLYDGHVSGVVDARSATKEEVGMMMTRLGKGESADA
ncbi:MAG: ABC transporter ATP-binding protein [Clostridia bacterium]|nr:ABC transporter ATP-binding protein [Clostridia bacterium]